MVEREQVLAFRVARQGLDGRRGLSLADAAACPASDFACYGRALIAADDDDLGRQLGTSLRRRLSEKAIAPHDALDEVTAATTRALGGGGTLSKDELHEALRGEVRDALLPWCKGCQSHHVAPMLWRYAGVQAGMRCDSQRRYRLGEPGEAPDAAHALRRFLHFYGPATGKDFGGWAGLAPAHARRVWDGVADELDEVRVGGERRWILATDEPALASPPEAGGVRLLPPGDPYLQHPDRTWLAPDPALRKRLFRPVASPGAVLQDGRWVGLWRVRARGRRAEVEVEELAPIDRDELESEATRVASLRGAESAEISWS